jgi:hypothetical protein
MVKRCCPPAAMALSEFGPWNRVAAMGLFADTESQDFRVRIAISACRQMLDDWRLDTRAHQQTAQISFFGILIQATEIESDADDGIGRD